jgi:hypothetical protein
MSLKTVLAAAVAVAAFAGLAAAQDFSAAANYGEASLNPGFMPDPYAVSIVAGGSIDASNWDASCTGMVSSAPDFRLHYGSGGYQLFAGVTSSSDTTLVINGPDGSWFCNDDYDGSDPFVGGENPMAGQYDIWVGTYGGGTAEATLYITEASH